MEGDSEAAGAAPECFGVFFKRLASRVAGADQLALVVAEFLYASLERPQQVVVSLGFGFESGDGFQ